MLDFLPAEASRVAGDMPPEDRKASLNLLDNHAPVAPEEDAHIARRWEELKGQMGEVMGGWHVYERSHPSRERKKGVLGKANHLLSRIYPWPMMRKQIDYNASIARALREISRQLADLQARVALQSMLTSGLVSKQSGGLGDVAAELEALRGRIEQLEGEGERRDDYG